MKIEDLLNDAMGGGDDDGCEYKFEVGDYVLVTQTGFREMKEHWLKLGIESDTYKGFIRSRRNAYPGMGSYPIYYVVGLGEVFENCLTKLS